MRKVQDHYFKKARNEGYPARSVYKLKEAQEKFRILRKGDRVLDLGCHPGSWTMYAAQVAGPGGVVVGIDIHATRIPAKAAGAEIKIIRGDINDPDLRPRIVVTDFDVVLSDMAPKTTGNRLVDERRSLDLVDCALLVVEDLLVNGGVFYCKVFEGPDLKETVARIGRGFKKTRIFKPKSSRRESREVFVLATGFFRLKVETGKVWADTGM